MGNNDRPRGRTAPPQAEGTGDDGPDGHPHPVTTASHATPRGTILAAHIPADTPEKEPPRMGIQDRMASTKLGDP